MKDDDEGFTMWFVGGATWIVPTSWDVPKEWRDSAPRLVAVPFRDDSAPELPRPKAATRPSEQENEDDYTRD